MDWSEYYEIRGRKYAVTDSRNVYQVLSNGRWRFVTDPMEKQSVLDFQRRHKEQKGDRT